MLTLSLMTIWPRLKNELLDYFFNRAGTEWGFLRLVVWIRFVMLLSFTLRFGISIHRATRTDHPILVEIVPYILWLYFFYIVRLQYLAEYHPHHFDSKTSKVVQVIVDIGAIAFFYAAANDPDSDIFFFYLLPLLVVARYFSGRAVLRFALITMLLTTLTWYFLFDNPVDFPLLVPDFWLLKLLSRLGFLAMLTVFYVIYQRRRSMMGHLNRAEGELVHQFHQLAVGTFIVDKNLCLTSMNQVMQERHGYGLLGSSCQNAFCRSSSHPGQPCRECPLSTAINRKREVASVTVQYSDRYGELYKASISAQPLLNEQGQVIGALGIVYDLTQHEAFVARLGSYGDDVERALDAYTQEERQRQQEKTRQLEAISRASAAILDPEQPQAVDEIMRAMASLLRCQWANIRLHRIDKDKGEGLYLTHSHGYQGEDMGDWDFLALNTQSIVVDVFCQGKALHLNDIQLEAARIHFHAWMEKHGMYSMACFPLLAQEKPLGTVSLHRNRREPFNPEEMALGQALANNLAAAIFNQNLLDRLSYEATTRQKGLDALNTLSRQLTPHHQINSLAQLATSITREKLNAEISSLFLLQGKTLYREAIAGVPLDWFTEEQYEVGQGITGRTIIEHAGEFIGQTICDNAIDHNAQVMPEHFARYAQILKAGKPRHLLAVPLNGHGGTFGVLRVVNKLDDTGQLSCDGFTEQDVELMTTIACIVAVALENTRRLAEQTFLMEVGQTITSTLSPEQILSASLNKAVAELSAEAGAVIQPESNSGNMVFRFMGGQGAEKLKGRVIPCGQGITGDVYKTGQPALVPDVTQDPRFYREVEAQTHFTTRSLVSVPIKAGKQVVGVLEILNKRQGNFTVTDLNLLTALSTWMAIAIENARLYEAEKDRRQLAETLREVMHTISATLDLDKILESILDQLGRVVQYHSASLFLREGNQLRLKAAAGFLPEETEVLKSVVLDAWENKPFRYMESTWQPYVIADNQREHVLDQIIGTQSIRAWIGAPLVYQGRIMGHLSVDSWKPHQYDKEDAEVVMAFAHQAAIAIANAQLFAQKRTLDESLLDIMSASSREEMLDQIAHCVRDLVHCDMAGIALYDPETEEIYGLSTCGHTGVKAEYMREFRFHINRPGGIILRVPRIYTTADIELESHSIFGQRLTRPLGVRGIMAAPLLVGEWRVGILYAGSKLPREFSEDEQTLFSILAKQAAVAIRNVELLQETNRRAELQALFHQMSVAGQRTSSLDYILNIVLTGVTAEYGLRFNRAMLLLLDSTREKLEGYTGIGQTDRLEARAVWENIGKQSFNGYVRQVLENGLLPPTPIHYVARSLQIPIQADSQEMFSRAFLTKKGMIVDPAEGQWLIHAEFYRLFNPGQFALVPLATDKNVIGMMVVDNKFTGDSITVQDLELLEACASQAAAAIERARLHSDIQKQVEVLFHLQKMGQFISQLSDLRDVLQRIVEAANQVLKADVSYLTPYDHGNKKSLVELGVGAGKQHKFSQGHESEHSQFGLTERVLNDPGGLVIIETLADHPDLISRFAQQEKVHSVAVVRLEIHGEVVGILYVNYRTRHLFSESELSVLRLFADQAAIAIHNAQLMQQVEQRERNRLREDIHDALNTFQFKVKLPLEVVRNRLEKEDHLEVAAELNGLWHFCNYVDEIFYRILQDMREPVLVERGLAAAIKKLTILENGSQLDIRLKIEGQSRPSPDVEHALYRITQEAIINIVKHAYPDKTAKKPVWIKLVLRPTKTHLLIRDKGVGFDLELSDEQVDCIGIGAMKRWAQNAGTELLIHSKPGKGTTIEVLILVA